MAIIGKEFGVVQVDQNNLNTSEGEGVAFVIQGGDFAPPVVGSNGGINSDPEPIPVGND
jgi:hypothetical protein